MSNIVFTHFSIILCISFSSYLIDQDVCYLVLCEQSYSKKLAFSFLEDLAQEFSSLYGKKVHSVNRPYSFIEFGTTPSANVHNFRNLT